MTTGTKSLYPLRRREGVSHDALVDHWRNTHAPMVKEHMRPDRYSITFFDPRDGRAAYDGMPAIFFADAGRAKATSGRNMPPEVLGDGFGDRIELPMSRVQAIEHVIVPGPGPHGDPATVAEREGAYKLTFLVSAREGVDLDAVQRHWIDAHAPNVASGFLAAGGVRYVVNLADRSVPEQPFAGVAELWYRDREAARAHRISDDGFVALTDGIALPGHEYVVTA